MVESTAAGSRPPGFALRRSTGSAGADSTAAGGGTSEADSRLESLVPEVARRPAVASDPGRGRGCVALREHRVVVVGAGVGGLVSALLLACAGLPVTLVERATTPGGKLRQLSVDGAAIDAGPTVFTMRWVFEQIFANAGESFTDHVALRPLGVLARHAWSGDASRDRLDLFADPKRSAEAIGRFSSRPKRAASSAFAASRAPSTTRSKARTSAASGRRWPACPATSVCAAWACWPAWGRSRRCGARWPATSTTRGCSSCSAATPRTAARRRSRRRPR